MSAMLFIILSEILAIILRENKSIQRIVVNNEEYKVCQLADDTTLIVINIRSALESISCLNLFYTYSDLKINLEKSIIMPMGRCKNKPLKFSKERHKLKFNDGAFKTLGVWFASDQEEMTNLSFENKLKVWKR